MSADLTIDLRDGTAGSVAVRHAPVELETLYREHRPRLLGRLRLKWRITGHLAEDLLHDAWVRAIEHHGRFDADRPFEPWVTRILDNVVIDHFRTTRTVSGQARQVPVDVDDSYSALAPSPRPDDERLADRETLSNALAALPVRQQQTAVGVLVNGLTLDEAASSMKLSNVACRQLLHRARVGLRRALIEQGVLPGIVLPLSWLRRRALRLASSADLASFGVNAISAATVAAVVAVAVAVGGAAIADAHNEPVQRAHTEPAAQIIHARPESKPASRAPRAHAGAPRRDASPLPSSVRREQPAVPSRPDPGPARRKVTLPGTRLPITGTSFHQDSPQDQAFEYGARIETPSDLGVQVGVLVTVSDAPQHRPMCDVAAASPVVTYCDTTPDR